MDECENPPDGRLLKVYPPEGVEDGTSVDIIAIHGLGTTTPRTWEFKTEMGVVNWLSDSNMLPDIVPYARIYTFSWNAKYYTNASVARIEDVSEIFLANLQSQRDKEDTHSRPFIFVASCFGGLVVTKALEIANIHDSHYRQLLVATSGVVFLGSPLQGTKAGNAAQWQAMLGGILNKSPSSTLVEDLDGSTRALRKTSERFVSMVTTPPMQTMTMCFWESRKTQVLKAVLPAWTLSHLGSIQMILVEEDSACLFGRPKQMLDAPHSKMNKFIGPSDTNFGLVSNAIKKMVEQAKSIALSQREAHRLHNEHFMISRRPNPKFTGREEELRKLEKALCFPLSTTVHYIVPRIYVVHGMGGAGKSEVAVKFAHEKRLEFWGIFWINGRSESSITNGFAAIARMCGHHDESLEGAILWLQNSSHSWLLIIDNADNQDLDLARFLPAGRNGSILITTRLTECAKHQTVGKDHYERLSQETAIDLLLKACDIELSSRSDHENDARVVVELLGCHALAITQAGAAISQNLCSLGEYEKIFSDQRQELFDVFPGQAQSEYGGVYATFEVSATYLRAREARDDRIAKDALQLLNLYAFMHFSDFPEMALEEAWKNSKDDAVVSSRLLPDGEENIESLAPWHVTHLPNFMYTNLRETKSNKIRVRRARSLLESLSLVTFDSTGETTRMHPVSHFWSRDRLQEWEDITNARLTGLSLLSLSLKDPFTLDPSPLSIQLQPHIESLAHSLKEWDAPKGDFHFQQSVYRLSHVMFRLSCDPALFELLQMIPIQADELWIKSRNGQRVQVLHGRCMCDFGDASEALAVQEKLHDVRIQALAPGDPMLLSSQHDLAMTYLKTGESTKAIALLEGVVHTRNESLQPDDLSLLDSQHELAKAYMKIDETTKAITLLEMVVEIESKAQRLEHPSCVTSQQELALAYLKMGERGKAISLLEEVMEVTRRTLRPEHQGYRASQFTLAEAYMTIEETAKAIDILKSLVAIEANMLKPEHPDRLGSQRKLAKAYLKLGESTKATALLEEVLEIRKRTLSPEHQDLLTSQHELARAYLENKKTGKAIAMLEEVVEIRSRTLRPEHQDLLGSQYALTRAYLKIRKTDKAIALLKDVVEIRIRMLRPEHRERLTSQHELARAYLKIGETDKAIALLEEVVQIKERTLKPQDRERVVSIYMLATCHYEARNYERALELAESIKDIAQNWGKDKIADWNLKLIGYILEDMNMEGAIL